MRALAIASMLCSVVVGRALKCARLPQAKPFPMPSSDAGIQWSLTEEQVRDSLEWWTRAISSEEISFWRRYRAASAFRRAPRTSGGVAGCVRRVAQLFRSRRSPSKKVS